MCWVCKRAVNNKNKQFKENFFVILVIPDVHLKPWMFERADALLKLGVAEKAACLMDIPDEWDQGLNLDLYID